MEDLVEQQWKEFERMVVSLDAGMIQRQEMRRAFIAGMWSALCIVRNIGVRPLPGDENGMQIIEEMVASCEAFNARVGIDR